MADVLFMAIVVAFFGALVLLVKACDRIIGAELVLVDSTEDGAQTEIETENAA